MPYGEWSEGFVIDQSMREAAGEAAPEPEVVGPEKEPTPVLQVVTNADGSKAGQWLGHTAAALRWNMARSYATKVAPLKTEGLITLGEHVRLEALDPKHRMGELLARMMRHYKANTPPIFHAKLSVFFKYVDAFCRDNPEGAIAFLVSEMTERNRKMCVDFVAAGVAYKETAIGRATYQLTPQRGKLFQMDQPFDTAQCQTAHSGAGWAIYVVSPSGKWFAGSHRIASFHHSSFLAGRPVLSAGEMQVRNGTVTLLSAKSGHYKPTMEQFVNGIKSLKKAGVSLSACKVQVYEAGAGRKLVRLEAAPFLVSGYIRSQYTAWG